MLINVSILRAGINVN